MSVNSFWMLRTGSAIPSGTFMQKTLRANEGFAASLSSFDDSTSETKCWLSLIAYIQFISTKVFIVETVGRHLSDVCAEAVDAEASQYKPKLQGSKSPSKSYVPVAIFDHCPYMHERHFNVKSDIEILDVPS